jgi:hypothetical protein
MNQTQLSAVALWHSNQSVVDEPVTIVRSSSASEPDMFVFSFFHNAANRGEHVLAPVDYLQELLDAAGVYYTTPLADLIDCMSYDDRTELTYAFLGWHAMKVEAIASTYSENQNPQL